jgi:hypothetical protein
MSHLVAKESKHSSNGEFRENAQERKTVSNTAKFSLTTMMQRIKNSSKTFLINSETKQRM